MENKTALNYKDIVLVPNKCVVKSRSECDTSIEFCGHRFSLPVTCANMASVLSEENAKWMAFNNLFYIYHRFSDTRKFIQRARSEAWPLVSISVGVQESDRELIEDISKSKCRVHFITIDIAHGLSDSTSNMIKFIKDKLPETKVIAGNIHGDKNSIEFLQSVGADSVKIGLSMGLGCSTFNETGFGSPMFSAALEAGRWAKVPVILDGGIRDNGDFAKAISAFTSVQNVPTYGGKPKWKSPINVPMIMAGSIFAACIDTPGETISKKRRTGYFTENRWNLNGELMIDEFDEVEEKTFKVYYGSASAESKKRTGQEAKHVEGKTVLLECNNLTYEQKFAQVKGAIQSQISYAGGKDLTALKDVEWRLTLGR